MHEWLVQAQVFYGKTAQTIREPQASPIQPAITFLKQFLM